MATATLTEQDVLKALKGVKDPDLGRDLVDLGMIRDVQIGAGTVALAVNLTTPACPMKAKIESDVRAALTANLGDHLTYHIKMTAEVRGKGVQEKGDIPGVKNVIAVGSGKGGVGKSTMAAAIAYGLSNYGSRVGLLDADIYGPSIPTLVGVKGRPFIRGDKVEPLEADGLKLMSIGFLIEPDQAVVARGPIIHQYVTQFLHQVNWGELDYLVIDLPPGTGDVPLTLAQALPLTGAVVVCTPQEVALADAVRAVAMFRKLNVPLLGLVENMSYYVESDGKRVYLFGREGARRKAEELSVPFLGEVPLHISLREKGDEGRFREVFAEEAPSHDHLLRVVEQLAAQISIQNHKKPKLPKLEILG